MACSFKCFPFLSLSHDKVHIYAFVLSIYFYTPFSVYLYTPNILFPSRYLYIINNVYILSPSMYACIMYQFSSVQSLSPVRLFATTWIAARQASLSITNSWIYTYKWTKYSLSIYIYVHMYSLCIYVYILYVLCM